jgi:hypothetical protein
MRTRIASALFVLVLAGCGSSHPATTKTTGLPTGLPSLPTSVPSVAAAKAILAKLPGCTYDSTLGTSAADGSGLGACYYGASYWHPDQNLQWGEGVTLYTYPSNEARNTALQNVSPKAHKAVLVGDGWAATVEAGSSNRLDVDPAKIATQLGGQVLRFWP